MVVAIIVAIFLWLPPDCAGRTAVVDAGPAKVSSTTAADAATAAVMATVAAAAAAAAATETTAAETTEVETTATTETTATETTATTETTPMETAATKTTFASGQFSVDMIMPFSKSTIRYSYTEPSVSAFPDRIPDQTTDVDQAHSMSVSPYGCDTVDGSTGGQRKRKRKRVRWKTSAVPTSAAAADDDPDCVSYVQFPTNTIVPLPTYPTADSGRSAVFEAAAEQLDQLYTVSRVDGATSGRGSSDSTEESDEDSTVDGAKDSTVK